MLCTSVLFYCQEFLIKYKRVQIITTILLVIFLNLGKRQPGEARYGSPKQLALRNPWCVVVVLLLRFRSLCFTQKEHNV